MNHRQNGSEDQRKQKKTAPQKKNVLFPQFPFCASEIRMWLKFLLKPKEAHLSKVTMLAGALWTALSLCACWGAVPKEGQDNIACLKELLQKTFSILGCILCERKLFSTSAEWYSLLTTIGYLQIYIGLRNVRLLSE